MAINRASIAKELLPGLNAVFGIEYGQVNDEHKSLYEVENSDRAFEEEVLFTGFGSAPVKSEGAAVSYDDAQESYTARYTAETVALAFIFMKSKILTVLLKRKFCLQVSAQLQLSLKVLLFPTMMHKRVTLPVTRQRLLL